MKVNNITQTNFNGIRLKEYSFEDARNLMLYLKAHNINVAGYKKMYTATNSPAEVYKKMSFARRYFKLYDDECGFVIFPWLKESWLIANSDFEKKLSDVVNEYDKNAVLNMLI